MTSSINQEGSKEDSPFISHSNRVPERVNYRPLFCRNCPFWIQSDDPTEIRLRYGLFLSYPTAFGIVLEIFCGIFWIIYIGPAFWDYKPWVVYIFALLYTLDLWSLVATLWANPGVLPYDYFLDPRKKYTYQEICAGTAYTQEQMDYAKSQKYLGRMIFSQRTGTYILRADHFCPWVGNFIGAYNHHLFFLVTFYLFLACSFALGSSYYAFQHYQIFSSWIKIAPFWIITTFFVFSSLSQFISQIYSITKNRTYIELLKQVQPIYDRGCFNNWEEVCGKREYILCWLLPIQLPLPIDPFTYQVAPATPAFDEHPLNTSDKEENNSEDIMDGI